MGSVERVACYVIVGELVDEFILIDWWGKNKRSVVGQVKRMRDFGRPMVAGGLSF